MQKLQKKQSYRRTFNKIGIIDIVIILLIFSAPILNCVLYITKRNATSGQLAIVYIIVAILSVVAALRYFHSRVSYNLITCIIGFLIILVSFLVTKISWEINNATFESELKLYLATIPSIILITYSLEARVEKNINLNLIFLIEVMITIVCGLVIFNGNGKTSAGLLKDTSGFLYQNTSYYAAYAVGMSVFLITEKLNQAKNKKVYFLIAMTLIQLLICISAGGRGGVVLAIALIVVGVIMVKGIKKAIFWTSLIGIFLVALFGIIPEILMKIGIDITGLERIVEFAASTSDNSRSILWKYSFFYFKEHPILGNGIGSVFFLFDQYSHNMLLDILCETGIIGALIFFIVAIFFIKKIKKVYKKGSLYRFMLITFICGIVMNLFSGYIWVNQQVLLPFVVIICSKSSYFRRKYNESY